MAEKVTSINKLRMARLQDRTKEIARLVQDATSTGNRLPEDEQEYQAVCLGLARVLGARIGFMLFDKVPEFVGLEVGKSMQAGRRARIRRDTAAAPAPDPVPE